MKKVFLVVATMLATVVMAQDVTLSQLMTQPFMSESNVFTSSLNQIASEWRCKITNGKEGEKNLMYSDISAAVNGRANQTMIYKGAKINDVSISESVDGTRFVIIYFNLEGTPELKSNMVAKTLKKDIKDHLGVKMPGGSISRLYEGLPSSLCLMAITYGDDEYVLFSYKLRIGSNLFK